MFYATHLQTFNPWRRWSLRVRMAVVLASLLLAQVVLAVHSTEHLLADRDAHHACALCALADHFHPLSATAVAAPATDGRHVLAGVIVAAGFLTPFFARFRARAPPALS